MVYTAASFSLELPMALFTEDGHALVANGTITVTFRLWKSPHVKPAKTYASGFGGGYHIESVTLVRAGDVTAQDARAAGAADVAALLEVVAAHSGTTVTPDMTLHRVALRYVEDAPQRAVLDPTEVLKRLARLDKASKSGAWTQKALRLIADQPRVVSTRLAKAAGMERMDFKTNIRKLKALGLTLSHDVGYELTPLGHDVLARLEA